jgi:uncharacterized protein
MRDYRSISRKASSALRKQGAKHAGIFGSFARGQAKKTSDIDLLVEFKSQKSLMELVRIERELSEDLGMKVDLLTKGSVSPHIIGNIEKDLVVLY